MEWLISIFSTSVLFDTINRKSYALALHKIVLFNIISFKLNFETLFKQVTDLIRINSKKLKVGTHAAVQ